MHTIIFCTGDGGDIVKKIHSAANTTEAVNLAFRLCFGARPLPIIEPFADELGFTYMGFARLDGRRGWLPVGAMVFETVVKEYVPPTLGVVFDVVIDEGGRETGYKVRARRASAAACQVLRALGLSDRLAELRYPNCYGVLHFAAMPTAGKDDGLTGRVSREGGGAALPGTRFVNLHAHV